MNNLIVVGCWLLVVSSWLLGSKGIGQTIIRWPTRPLMTLEGDIRFTYDDNIFLYSAQDLNDFRHSVRPYRFPFTTTDDFITTLTGILRFRTTPFPTRPLSISIRYRQHIYAVNRIKSYQLISLNLVQGLSKQFEFAIGYSFLPEYLIRYYKDPTVQTSPPTYIGCDFTQHLFNAELNYRIKRRLLFTPFYKYEIDDYTDKFDYYDTKANRFGFAGSYNLKSWLALNGEIEYKLAKAKGPVPDISYRQFDWLLGINLGTNPRVRISYNQEYRKFITTNLPSIDPFHSGRVDRVQNLKLDLEISLSKAIRLVPNYEFEIRKVTSPYKETIDEIKDYQNNRFGLRLNLRRF
ncbi:MAG: hypothetical protein ABIK93_09915 [candidate division WOR-3 bacterium]